MTKYLKRPGASNRKQQVWVHWDYATDKEKRLAIEELARLAPSKGGAFARPSDTETAEEAARSISPSEATRLETIVARAVRRYGRDGLTWDEAPDATGLDKASISPRWKPLRRQKKIVKALEEEKEETRIPLVRRRLSNQLF